MVSYCQKLPDTPCSVTLVWDHAQIILLYSGFLLLLRHATSLVPLLCRLYIVRSSVWAVLLGVSGKFFGSTEPA